MSAHPRHGTKPQSVRLRVPVVPMGSLGSKPMWKVRHRAPGEPHWRVERFAREQAADNCAELLRDLGEEVHKSPL